jgi:ZIP family zinc transporter
MTIQSSLQQPPPFINTSEQHAILLSFLAGASTGVGGAIVVLIMIIQKRRGEQEKYLITTHNNSSTIKDPLRHLHGTLALALGSAIGVMVTVSILDMYGPVMYRNLSNPWPTLALIIGIIIFSLISKRVDTSCLAMEHQLPILATDHIVTIERKKNLRLALVLFISLTIHNAPEGLATAFAYRSNEKLGLRVAFAVASHNLPEGACISAPLFAASSSITKSIGAAILSGLSEPFGALISTLLLGPMLRRNPEYTDYLLCAVAGIMLGACAFELLPAARAHQHLSLVWIGCCIGCFVMFSTIFVV